MAPSQRPTMSPCPCGGAPTLNTAGLADYVHCPTCGEKGPEFTSGEEYAIMAWNEMCRDLEDQIENGYYVPPAKRVTT